MHELVLGESVQPNRSREVEGLQRAGHAVVFLAHMENPIEVGLSEVYPGVVQPPLPLSQLALGVLCHLHLLALVDPSYRVD